MCRRPLLPSSIPCPSGLRFVFLVFPNRNQHAPIGQVWTQAAANDPIALPELEHAQKERHQRRIDLKHSSEVSPSENDPEHPNTTRQKTLSSHQHICPLLKFYLLPTI